MQQNVGGATATVRGDEIQPGDVLLEAGQVERVVSIRPGATPPVLYATVELMARAAGPDPFMGDDDSDGPVAPYEVLFLREERLTVHRAA